jgi:hypothetical protein
MFKIKKDIWIAALVNLLLFIVFSFLFYPIYNSQEDVYVLYLLSGGYGSEPTAMLHFNLGLHPFLNWFIKSLFLLTNQVNWYSVVLFMSHYVFCTIVLAYVIRKKNTLVAYVSYAALFLVFEGYFLLFPDFTGACMILTASGLLLLLTRAWHNELKPRHYVFAVLLFVLASFFRMESMIVLPGIALPFLALTVPEKIKWKLPGILCIAGLVIFLFNVIHKSYYTAQKPDWPQEEAYRQKILRFYNESSSLKRPQPGEKWYPEYEMIIRGVIMDTTFLPSSLLDSVHTDMKQARTVERSFSADWKIAAEQRKWFLINNRIFLCLTLLFIILYGLGKRITPALLLSLCFLIAGLGFLLLKAKTEPYILISSLSLICFTVFLHNGQPFFQKKRIYEYITLAALFLFIAWGSLRIYRTSQQNRQENARFKSQYAEIAAHPQTLFINIRGLAIQKFHAFDIPAKSELANYLSTELFITNNYHSTLEKFHIGNIKDIFSSPNVLFWGEPSQGLKAYFERIAGRPLVFSSQLQEFKTGFVWRVQ